ncbi:glycosyltransferase family 2 protein [Geomesophilobacter sediminis]|uniref:Glycosyltransferase family 2 protein n=1 Tax=Geomesophilobacter sediminis TaxID=2798584 RepID=A0A8J7LZ19_9BACT|nr:glycosyltransferase family 2 protein [Geomesophilobacter sediminis]MBJ6725947.1 glycosyltransferase family 2 protein [Geomesophilobacter sediminis]
MDITFVTVNYNTKKLLQEMVSFFAGTEFPFSYSFVVVDNDSRDGSVAYLAQAPGVVPILNRENCGYGRAMNQGIAASDSRYVCILNTDLILNRAALVALWEYLESHPETGLACPLICDPGTLKPQNFIFHESLLEHYVETVSRSRARALRRQMVEAREPFPVQGVMGSFMILRRSLIGEEGLFDEDFIFYYEDTDLAHRLKARGVRCMVLPEHQIVHLGGQSSSNLSSLQVFLNSRHRYLMKHFGVRHTRNILCMVWWRTWIGLQKYRTKAVLLRRDSDKKKLAFMQRNCGELGRLIAGTR